jgi:predicted kinase
MGCPAVCRDEIKEGMVHATGDEFVAAPGDELTLRTLPAFFGVLEILLKAGVTTVAEAAFQDHVWRPRLESLRRLARVRLVQCVVAPEMAFARVLERGAVDPLRQAHADPQAGQAQAFTQSQARFVRVSLDVPSIDVDTTEGYRPGLDEIVSFVNHR